MNSGGESSATRKRSSAGNSLDQMIVILVESHCGWMSLGMYKFNIQINKENATPDVVIWTERDTNTEKDLKSAASAASSDNEKVELKLQPMETLYNQNLYQEICKFGFCRLKSKPEELLLFPQDCKTTYRRSATPCVFNLITKEREDLPESKTAKWEPVAAAVGDYIYVLSTGSTEETPEPRFEVYDPALKKWSPAPELPYTGWEHPVTGYVVLKEKFIVVCLSRMLSMDETEIHSYNTETGLWKPVKLLPVNTKEETYPAMFGECPVSFEDGAVASGDGVIYSYLSKFQLLIAFPYSEVNKESEDSKDHDLTFGPASFVEGFQVETITTPPDDVHGPPFDYECGTIVKVDHNVFCQLHAEPHFTCDPEMRVSGLIIKIHDDDFKTCTVLKNFTCSLAVSEVLCRSKIKSCVVIQPGEHNDEVPFKQARNYLPPELVYMDYSTSAAGVRIEHN